MVGARWPNKQTSIIVLATGATCIATALADDRIVLTGGDVLTGTITAATDRIITLDHTVLGTVILKRTQVDALIYDDRTATDADPTGHTAPQEPAPDSVEPDPTPEDPWEWRIELGFNGSDGRTERFDGRLNVVLKRETNETRTAIDALYRTATSRGDRTLNRFETGIINDWLFPDSPWFSFAKGRFELDEFTAYDYRISGAGGVGYEFIKTEKTTLIGRLGAGASTEVGGPRDGDVIPEALAILDYRSKISATSTFTATGEYYPDVSMFSDYRAVLTAAIETKLAPNSPLSMKFGVRDEIEEFSNGSSKEDLFEYFGVLVWDF